MTGHPTETQLALFAGGDCGAVSRFLIGRHVRNCAACTAEAARFEILRSDVAEMAQPELDWSRISAEMRANIYVGLAAGECVRSAKQNAKWNPRLAVAFGSLALLLGAGFLMRHSAPEQVRRQSSPTLESTDAGLELRNGASSITILNRHGAIASQTVSAQGQIGARYIDGDTGAVTINNVYLE